MKHNKCLKDFDGNRRNNFTLIRWILAWAVLYGHSYAVQNDVSITDPLSSYIFKGSTWIGAVAVDGFFVISGFLVTASYCKRGLLDYTISRLLRIIPALSVCVFLSVFILGGLLTSLPVMQYFSHSGTYDYLTNALGFITIKWNLPGVFESQRVGSVNGSLWTLNTEMVSYYLLAILGVFHVLKYRVVANIFFLGLLLFAFFHYTEIYLFGDNSLWKRPGLFFVIGVLFFINREAVLFDGRLAILATILMFYSFGRNGFMFLYPLMFSYLLFYLSYCTKYISLDDKIGDCSYGIYIYAWPIQQTVAYFFGEQMPYFNTIISTIIVLPLAYASWAYIEKPALGLKKHLLRTQA